MTRSGKRRQSKSVSKSRSPRRRDRRSNRDESLAERSVAPSVDRRRTTKGPPEGRATRRQAQADTRADRRPAAAGGGGGSGGGSGGDNPDSKTAEVAFLKNKKFFKKELEGTVSKTNNKGWCGNILKKNWSALDSDAQDTLKQSKYDAVQAHVNAKVAALKSIAEELLASIDSSTVDDWVTRRNQILTEYDAACKKVNEFMGEVKEMRSQEADAKRTVSAAVSYQLKKLTNGLIAGGYSKHYAKYVADILRADSTVMVVHETSQVSWDRPMVFEPESAAGKAVQKGLDSYMTACAAEASVKVGALERYLSENDSKGGAMSIVPNSPRVHNLSQIFNVPDDMLLYNDEGASPWVVGSKPFKFRFEPSMFPLPGCGQIIKKVGKVGCSLIMLPVSKLVEAGVIMLHELPSVLHHEEGCEVLEASQVISWAANDGHAVWCPWGWLPIHCSSIDEDNPSFLWCLPVLERNLAAEVPEQVWKPLFKLIQDHSQKLSGETVWKERLKVMTKLAVARETAKD